MKYYEPKDFEGKDTVAEGVPFKDLTEEVLAEYFVPRKLTRPEEKYITDESWTEAHHRCREMAQEIVELRTWCYQGGMPWPFKEKK